MRVVGRLPETDRAEVLVRPALLRVFRSRLSRNVSGRIDLARILCAATEIRSLIPGVTNSGHPALTKLVFKIQIPGSEQRKAPVLFEHSADRCGQYECCVRTWYSWPILVGEWVAHARAAEGVIE